MTVPRGPLWDYPLFGLPINGLAENEKITLPNGHTVDYPFSGHWAMVARGRDAGRRRPPLTAAQQTFARQAGYRFRDYALLTGMYREIAGVQLGPQSWLYSDERHTWVVRLDIAKLANTNRLHIKLVLVNVFGLLQWDGTPPTMPEERVLAEIVFPLKYRYIEARVDDVQSCPVYVFATHSDYGDVSVINLCTTCEFQGPTFGYQYGGSGYQTHTVLVARITGDGSVTPGSVGRGIRAELDVLKQTPDLFVGSTTYHYAAATPTGEVTWLTSTTNSTTTGDQTITGDVPNGNYVVDGWTAVDTVQTVSFAGVSVTASYSGGHSWHREYINGYEYWPAYQGIKTDPGRWSVCEASSAAGAVNNCVYWDAPGDTYACGALAGLGIHMSAPNVFVLLSTCGCRVTETRHRLFVAADGRSWSEGYDDPAGESARLVAYNPGSGEFAVAPTSSDVVQWV